MHFRLCFLLALLFAPLCRAADSPGIYADFLTSKGTFTCYLDYTNAPKAVANFITLATGQRAWLDEASPAVRMTNFYDGLTFHRVIANFMIQGGSRNGRGTDGPGYYFLDEFTPTQRFDGPGVLAMANSGPDSNGAQFFVTLSAQPSLNDVHTIFGRVTAGQSIVDSIGKVSTDANDKPLTNVVIQAVQIRRVGTQAQNFNAMGQSLPTVSEIPCTKTWNGTNFVIGFTNKALSDTRVLVSTSLPQWYPYLYRSENSSLTAPWNDTFTWRAQDAPGAFFSMASQASYTAVRPVPKTLLGVVSFEFNIYGTNSTRFYDDGTAIYVWPSQGVVNALPATFNWRREPYRGRLLPISWFGIGSFDLHLNFATPTNGTFTGTSGINRFSGQFRFK